MPAVQPQSWFFIGWDVGGWHCDRNRKSRDALVILDDALRIIGRPWRGNLRSAIAKASTAKEWLHALFSLCEVAPPEESWRVTMAIDAPLGFPEAVVRLVTGRQWTEPPERSDVNPYLFRETERHLPRRPLSAIKDMIGSQATKAMHAVAKFAPVAERCGVWTDGTTLKAIESYPAACRDSVRLTALVGGRRLEDADRQDALTCALVAHLFTVDPDSLEPPGATVSAGEGWIWAPRPSTLEGLV